MTHFSYSATADTFLGGSEKKKREASLLSFLRKLKVPAFILAVILFTVILLGAVLAGIAGHYSRILNSKFTNPIQITQLMPPAEKGGDIR